MRQPFLNHTPRSVISVICRYTELSNGFAFVFGRRKRPCKGISMHHTRYGLLLPIKGHAIALR